jgi:isopentenyl-diphosphate delta-isomerase
MNALDDAAGQSDNSLDDLILVDDTDQPLGFLSKARCHEGSGVLHRAFSLFIFNPAGELLIQQRSAGKRLWPLYWSNSCCSHPRAEETMDTAILRRLHEELGLVCPLRFLFKFKYQAQFDATGAEHELCSVYSGTTHLEPQINRQEIAAWRFIAPAALESEISDGGELKFTPWFLIEWQRVRAHHHA